MGICRSAFYDTPEARARDLTIVAEMKTICDEFEAYGYRRVDAELRHRGIIVNAKKIPGQLSRISAVATPRTGAGQLSGWLSSLSTIMTAKLTFEQRLALLSVTRR